VYRSELAHRLKELGYEIERGGSAPSFETLEKILKRLTLPVSELFTFEDKPRQL
jgi:transcriptional regulator with XRE-family HTH domain